MMEKKYLAPNGITAANMFLGYLSIISSIKGNFRFAIWFIIFGMICDGLDGKAARKLDAYSEFGKEFDSFSDAVSFGLAPSILIYFTLNSYKVVAPFAIPIAFLYAFCAVVRLAKFNVMTVVSDEKDDFSGMPTPNGAAAIVSYLLTTQTMATHGYNFFNIEVFTVVTVISTILMVCKIPFVTPDKAFRFIPKKYMGIFTITVLATLKYSMFICAYYYIIYNLIKYNKTRKEIKNCQEKE